MFGAAALAVALPADRPARETVFAVVAPAGACELRVVEPARLAHLEAVLAEEAERLSAMAERLMADAAAARFAEAREQVPAFGAWAYDWVQSYITSYRVLGRLLRGLAASAHEGEGAAALSERVLAEMAQPVREEFRRRVLSPQMADALTADLAHTAAVLDDAWREALREAAAELAATPPAALGTTTALRLNLVASAQPLGPALAAMAPRDELAVLAGEPADTAAVFLRSMRPMAARVGAAVVRMSEAGSIVATAGAFGYALGGVPGVALGAAGGVGVSWAIDWGLNRVDAALNRNEFEAQALLALGAAERRIAERAGAAAAAALAQRLAALRPAEGGCITPGAGR